MNAETICASIVRHGKLSDAPPITAFDLLKPRSGYTPRVRVTQQAKSVNHNVADWLKMLLRWG